MNRIPADNVQGFTLIELMITIAIAAILLSIAVPAFTSTMERNRLTSYSNELLGSLVYARNEARIRNTEVQLCSSANLSTCDNEWNSQHQVILRQIDGTVLRQLPPPPNGSNIQVSAIEYRWDGSRLEVARTGEQEAQIRYRANGQLSANAEGLYARRLCLSLEDNQTPFALLQSGQVQIQPEVTCG